MKKDFIKIICTLGILATLVIPASASLQSKKQILIPPQPLPDDYDPLVDNITVTVTIHEIRGLDKIDVLSDPDFYVKITINDLEFTSEVWENTLYLKNLNWSASCEVPKDTEFVDITIALWDKGPIDRLCDLSTEYGNYTQCRTAELTYSIATGIWWGDDELGDLSGYGRLNGCDDNSMYQQDRDCELIFDISQNDIDNDGFPYWLETAIYNTSPLIDNRGEDADQDGIPIEWEYTFGLTYNEWGHNPGYYMVYDPFQWENHTSFDDDHDGLNNKEEYLTWQWGSDPFRQDLFVEIDQMEEGPDGQGGSVVPVGAYDLLRDAYGKHNIYWHVDDGRLGGGELIPFKDTPGDNDLNLWYWLYFMHQNASNWRRGVFHWGIIGYNASWAVGFTFSSRVGNVNAVDCFYLSSQYLETLPKRIPLIDSLMRRTFNREEQRAIVYAGVIMHETGHSLNIRAPGVDVQDGKFPWEFNYWRYGPYKSVMNYRYVYSGLIDYSDGSHGKNDYDDWANIDLTYFNPGIHW